MNSKKQFKNNNKSQYAIVGKKRNSPYRMSYKTYGHGDEKILFIMGYMLEGKTWHHQMEYYINQPDKYQVCEFDYCGVGESEFSFFYSKTHTASDVVELMEHLNWGKTNLIAISDGSVVAYEISLLAPHLIKTLSLYSILPSLDYKLFTATLGYIQFLFLEFYSFIYNVQPHELFRRLVISDTYIKSYPKLIQFYKSLYESRLKVSFLTKLCNLFANLFHSIKPIDSKQLNNRQFPIALYYATDDAFLNKSNFKKIVDLIKPNLIVHCIDSGHCIQVEDTNQFHKFNINFFEMNQSNTFKDKNIVIELKQYYNVGERDPNYIIPFSNMDSIFKILLKKLLLLK